MRVIILALLGAVLAGGSIAMPLENVPDPTPSPFPVQRGTAPPPPAEAGQAAPPEGAAPGGVDFGRWRSADPAVYETSFAAQMRSRLAGKTPADVQADLERNGFTCEQAGRLDCRIETQERQCAFDWYVVLEQNAAEPVAGFDASCPRR